MKCIRNTLPPNAMWQQTFPQLCIQWGLGTEDKGWQESKTCSHSSSVSTAVLLSINGQSYPAYQSNVGSHHGVWLKDTLRCWSREARTHQSWLQSSNRLFHHLKRQRWQALLAVGVNNHPHSDCWLQWTAGVMGPKRSAKCFIPNTTLAGSLMLLQVQ